MSRFLGINRAIHLAALGMGVACIAVSAHASQYETVSGNMCQSAYPANSSYSYDLYKGSTGIVNQSYQHTSGGRYVYCPITRVNGLTTTGLSAMYLEVSDNTGGLFCSAGSYDDWGNLIASTGNKSIPSAGTSKQIYMGGLTSHAWGHYDVFCAMPDKSVVHSIEYVEN